MSLRIAIVEDNARFRDTVRKVLKHAPGYELVAAFPSVEHLSSALTRPQTMAGAWDVVLMDIDLPGASGIEGTRMLKRMHPNVAVLVCTVFEEPSTILSAITAGADGYALKSSTLDDLLDHISAVAEGGSTLSAPVARKVLDAVRRFTPDEERDVEPVRIDLSDREREVLRCLVEGMSYKVAADQLGVSVNTVRSHIRALYRKLQVQNVAEAVSKAIRERLV